jgi:hypothetical protein
MSLSNPSTASPSPSFPPRCEECDVSSAVFCGDWQPGLPLCAVVARLGLYVGLLRSICDGDAAC